MDPYGNVVPSERDVFGNAVEGTPDPRNEYSDPLGRGLYSAFDEDDMGNSVVLDIEDDFGPINPDDEYKHELGYFLVLLLRGDSLSRQLKQDVFKMSVVHCIMGPAMFVISAVEDEKFSFTPYFKATMYYGSPLLDLQYTTSIFAIAMGWLGLLAVHHWASIISNRDLFTKLCKGFQALLAFMFAMSMWQMSIFFRVFQDADFSTEFHMQEIYGYYVFSIIFMLPYIVAALMYGLNLNYLQEMVDEGGLLEEPAPLPEHAMDLADVNVLDILGLCMLVPALIISQIYDFFVEIWDMLKKRWRVYQANRARAAVQSKSFWRRVKKTIDRVARAACGCPKNFGWTMGYKDPERITAEEAAEIRARQMHDDAAAAEVERAAQLERERVLLEAADAKARDLAEAKYLNVLQFRDLWNALPPAGSFQCNVKERPFMKSLVDHISQRGFHVVFASNTSTNPDDTDATSSDFEMGICNVRGADHAEFGRTWGSPKKNRADGAESRSELADGLGQGSSTAGDRYASDQAHHWFLARFRCTPTAFSAVMKAQDPTTITRYVKRFALAKVLKVDSGG